MVLRLLLKKFADLIASIISNEAKKRCRINVKNRANHQRKRQKQLMPPIPDKNSLLNEENKHRNPQKTTTTKSTTVSKQPSSDVIKPDR
jgi:hypothetical protein